MRQREPCKTSVHQRNVRKTELLYLKLAATLLPGVNSFFADYLFTRSIYLRTIREETARTQDYCNSEMLACYLMLMGLLTGRRPLFQPCALFSDKNEELVVGVSLPLSLVVYCVEES